MRVAIDWSCVRTLERKTAFWIARHLPQFKRWAWEERGAVQATSCGQKYSMGSGSTYFWYGAKKLPVLRAPANVSDADGVGPPGCERRKAPRF
jgi:hypothetical protein